MERTKRTWIALLLGALLLATLAGVVWARPQVHHGGFHYQLTIPGADFNPITNGLNWWNNGNYITMTSGSGSFYAPVPILPGNRTVESLTIYAYDNNGSFNLCVDLMREKADGTSASMAQVCSTGTGPAGRTFSTTAISPNKIWGAHGPYLNAVIPDPNHLSLYWVKIGYY